MRRNWIAESSVSFNYNDWIERVEEERSRKISNHDLTGILDEYEIVLEEGSVLSKDALVICDKYLQENPGTDVIYGDEDWIDADNKRYNPWFKPEISRESLLNANYFESLVIVKKSLMSPVLNEARGYELTLGLLDYAKKIGHVPAILCHRKSKTTAKTKEEISIKNEWLQKNGIAGHAEPIEGTGLSRIVYDVEGEPLVSVIIPSKDHPELLERVVSGLIENTDYKNIEIIIVDNGSSKENRERVEKMAATKYLYHPMDFNFSSMCNIGVGAAAGEYILLLNDDIEIPKTSANWLSRMIGQAQQPGVGAVGAKLYYPGGKLIQHDGVTSIFPGVAHFICRHDDNEVLPNAENRVDREAIAVTGACLLVKKSLYEEVGGFNENLAVAFNDVEFCFKLIRFGYRNVLRNDVVLIHHESISRGDDLKNKAKKKRMMAERGILFEAFPEYNGYDPYRNQMLNQFEPDMSYNYFITENTECLEISDDYKPGSRYAVKMVADIFKLTGRVMIAGSCVFILNDASPLKILLEGRSGRKFEISAKRFYRPEIRRKFLFYPYIAYGSFRAVADIDDLPKDEYEIFLIRHGKKYKAPCERLLI